MMDSIEMREFADQLVAFVLQKMRYYRTYSAVVKVVEDVESEAKVALECLDLGATTMLTYIWARPCGSPRAYHPPKVDDDVVLFFKDADPSAPVFVAEIPVGMYEVKPRQSKAVLFESELSGSILSADEVEGFLLQSKSQKGAQSEVSATCLGLKMKELFDYILDQYIKDIYVRLEKIDDDIINHKHIAPTGPTSPPVPPIPVNRSTDKSEIGSKKGDINSKKSDYAQPGNLLSHTNKNN